MTGSIMGSKRHETRRAATAVLVAAAAISGWGRPARADYHSNPMLPVGEAAGLMGGAAAAAVDDGSALWYNPAGLGAVRDQGISASLSAYGVQQLEVPGFVEYRPGFDAALTSTAVATFPSYLGYVQPFGGSRFRHSLGFAVVVPDFERADAVLDVPPGTLPFELRARLKYVSQTIWGMPGWGGCWATGRFCVGAALAAGYRTEIETTITDYRILGFTDRFLESATIRQLDIWMLSIGALAGVQWQILPRLRFGVSLRTPSRMVAGGGSLLTIESAAQSRERSSVRRVEDQKLRLDYKLPLQARAGISLDVGRFRFAADVNYSPAQAAFAFLRGRNGETKLQPIDGTGMVSGDPIDIYDDLERKALVDGAVGMAMRLGERWMLLAGVFTNRSGAYQTGGEDGWGTRYGGTLGLSRRGAKSTARFGVTATTGEGTIQGSTIDAERPVSTHSRAIYANIGGTADF